MRHKFNDLPQTVRERLVKLTQPGEKDPRILLQDVDWAGGWFKYVTAIGGIGVILFCLNFLFRRGMAGIHPRHDEEVFAGLAAGSFVLIVSVVAIVYRFLWKPPPYREGKWVFPSGLMQLSGGWVEFLPIAQLGRPTLVTVKRNGSYQHSRLELGHPFTFIFSSPATAEQTTSVILGAKTRMVALMAARDSAAIASLDPFAECTLSGKWVAPTMGPLEGPTAAIVPTAAKLAQWLGALVLAGGIAAGAFAFFSLAFKHH
jgi:hypothetical protein